MQKIIYKSALCFFLAMSFKSKSQCSAPSPVTASPATLCAGATTSLNATATGLSIKWYTVSVGGTTVGTSASGANFAVSPVTTTTFYAETYGPPSTTTLNYTGGMQSYTVPGGVTTLTVDLMGAQGGAGYPAVSQGGKGGKITGTISVTPGQVLQIYVGGAGGNGSASASGTMGYNGGGLGALYAGSYAGGGGGGASDIRVSPYALANRLAVAGGGGGGAYNSSTADYDRGGHGNGTSGEAGYSNGVSATGAGGYGGTQSAGGGGGFWSGYCTAPSGSLGLGGNAGSCTNSGGGGGGGYYGGGGGVWAGGGGGSSYLVNGTNTMGFQSGNGQVVITAPGCTSARTPVIVTVNANPTVSVNNGTICAGQSFTIIPSGASTYSIAGGTTVVNPSSNASYTVVGLSAQGCLSQNTATANVTVNSNPTISVNSGTLCQGSSYTISPSGANTYTFQGGSSVVSPTSSLSYTVAGTNTVTGCVSATVAASVTVFSAPVISVNSGGICSGQSFTMIPSGASSYVFEGGSAVVSPTANTNFTVTGTSTAGCVSQTFATATIVVNANPTITVNSGSICAGNSFTIIPSGASTYVFEGGNAVVSPTANTNYTVTGTSAAGCSSQTFATAGVTVNALPSVSVSGTGSICVGQTATLTASGANSYSWNTGSTSTAINVSPTITTVYTANGTSSVTGCSNSATLNLVVSLCTGINEGKGLLSETSLFPNPNNGKFTLKFPNTNHKTITIIDATGKLVMKQETEDELFEVNINSMDNGIYTVIIRSLDDTGRIKILKQ